MDKNTDFWEAKKQREILKAIEIVRKRGFLPYTSWGSSKAQRKLYNDVVEWGVMDGVLRHSQGFKDVPVEYDNDWLKENNIAEYEKVMNYYENLNKTVEYERIFLNTLRREKQKVASKERTYKEVKTETIVTVTKEKSDRTIAVIMDILYKEGDCSEIDTATDKEKKHQIRQLRNNVGLQNMYVVTGGKKIPGYINRAFKFGYANDIQTKERIEGMGFTYEKKMYTYLHIEEEIIKMALNYTTMTKFRKYNFNMWKDAERKGMLELMQRYCYHSSGRGGFNVKVPGLLYYIKSQGIYKIGITNLTIEQRFSHVCHKIEVIKTWHFDNGQEARDEEKRILREFSYAKHSAEGIEGLGNTELFTHDVLLLDTN